MDACTRTYVQYFAFGEPIETAHLGGDWENAAKCLGVYDKAKKEVERLIAHLQVIYESVVKLHHMLFDRFVFGVHKRFLYLNCGTNVHHAVIGLC